MISRTVGRHAAFRQVRFYDAGPVQHERGAYKRDFEISERDLMRAERPLRHQILARHIGRMMNTSPLTLFGGNTFELKARQKIDLGGVGQKYGFKTRWPNVAHIIAGQKYYTEDTSLNNVEAAYKRIKGNTYMIRFWGKGPKTCKKDLVNFFLPSSENPNNFENMAKEICFLPPGEPAPPSIEMGFVPTLRIYGAFLKEPGKTNRNLWIDIHELREMFAEIQDLAKDLKKDEHGYESIHDLYINKSVSMIQNQLGSITRPLEQGLQQLPDTLGKSAGMLGMTLQAIQNSKQNQA